VFASVLICGSCSGGDDQDGFDSGTRALSEGNYAEAYCRWKPLAQAGHADAQYHLGWLYANGNGLAVDIDRALEWWGAAARQGHADAQFAVGLAHTTGEGIGKDLREAVVWYLSAARQGHQDARDILIRLNGDPAVQLLDWHPEIANEDWFGWDGEVTGDRINLRAGPGTGYKVLTLVAKGTEVRVVGSRGDWHLVMQPDAAGKTAWIHRSLVSKVGS
jgi:hypothetical protein